MSKLFAMAIPILPGQTERWQKFIGELTGKWSNEFKASRNQLGVQERTFLQKTPMGDFVLVTLEGNDPTTAFTKFAEGTDAFTDWFKSEVQVIHGFDLATPPAGPLPELVADSGPLSVGGR